MTTFPKANARNDKTDLPQLKWVLKNKGEKVRARLVVREIEKAKSEDEKLEPSDLFCAMPPVESLKALVSHVMTERVGRRGRNLVLAVFDVSRAHCSRCVCVNAMCLRGATLRLTSFWTSSQTHQDDVRDAGCERCVEETVAANTSAAVVFELVARNPALYRSDFLTVAAEDKIESFGKLFQEKFGTRRIGLTGAAEHLDKELEVLHRSVKADQKHVHQLREDLGLTQSNIVKSPRVKLSVIEA